jgi:hypothetical protein
MRRYLRVALAIVWVCGASTPAPAGSSTGNGQCVGTVSPQVTNLLTQFPDGGPSLRAAVARMVEADASLAADAALAARTATAAQKQAIGSGLWDAASFFAKCGTPCRGAEMRVRATMDCSDAGTRVGFVSASDATLLQSIPGFDNAGAQTSNCPGTVVSPSRPGC